MKAHRARRRAAGLKLESRWVPASAAAPPQFSTHQILDARSLAMHSLIAQKLMHQPSLIDKARHNAERWLRRYGGDQPEYLIEWQQILARPIAEIAAIIVSQTEEAVRLRQSSPFAGFLTPAERRRVYEAFRA